MVSGEVLHSTEVVKISVAFCNKKEKSRRLLHFNPETHYKHNYTAGRNARDYHDTKKSKEGERGRLQGGQGKSGN